MNHSPNQSNPKLAPDGAAASEPNPLWQEAKQAVSQVADQAGEKLKTELDSKKGFAVDKATEMASKLRDTKQALKDVGPLPDLADQAADQIERLAEYVQNRNLGDLVREVERFARREPAIFLGVSFAAGLLGGRFLKSSGRRVRREPAELRDNEYAYIQDEPRFGPDTFATTPARKPEPMKTSTTTSPFGSLSSQTPSTPSLATRPSSLSPLPPVPPPPMERRVTQPMPAIKAESDLASKPSTTAGSTSPSGSFIDSIGKSNGGNGNTGSNGTR